MIGFVISSSVIKNMKPHNAGVNRRGNNCETTQVLDESRANSRPVERLVRRCAKAFAAIARLIPPSLAPPFNIERTCRVKPFNSYQYSIARAATHNVRRFKLSLAAQHLTPELTRRKTPPKLFNFSIRDKLIPVGSNELFGSALDVNLHH
jgi:hypothetical protein